MGAIFSMRRMEPQSLARFMRIVILFVGMGLNATRNGKKAAYFDFL